MSVRSASLLLNSFGLRVGQFTASGFQGINARFYATGADIDIAQLSWSSSRLRSFAVVSRIGVLTLTLTSRSCFIQNAVEKGFKYNISHEYANVSGDVATVGISDHAQVMAVALQRG